MCIAGVSTVKQHHGARPRSRGTHVRVLRRRPPRIQRARGMPDAGRTRGPCVPRKCTRRTQVTQGSRDTRHSPRNGLRLIRDLLGVPQLSSHRPLEPRQLKGWIPASGDRDHTISPSAPAAFVNCGLHVHRSPPPTFMTTAKRPPEGAGCGEIIMDFGKMEEEYFCAEGLTRF